MKETIIRELKRIEMRDPILVEGLPGIGLIGKIAADHLISELGAEKFAELYSPHFFHQALIEEGSILRLMNNEFYYWKGKGKELILLVGDIQPQPTDSYGHHEVVSRILEYAKDFGVRRIFTLGGLSTGGVAVREPRVFGSATTKELIKKYSSYEIVFRNDPGSAIVGASGLLLAIGAMMGMNGVCLLGESPGYLMADARAAKSILAVLCKILDLKIDMAALDKRAEETEEFIKKIQEMEKKTQIQRGIKPGDFSYIR
ncbi:MAG: proteasome assembly chaperone family protein [Candidatus Methanofastidiosia archaeon]